MPHSQKTTSQPLRRSPRLLAKGFPLRKLPDVVLRALVQQLDQTSLLAFSRVSTAQYRLAQPSLAKQRLLSVIKDGLCDDTTLAQVKKDLSTCGNGALRERFLDSFLSPEHVAAQLSSRLRELLPQNRTFVSQKLIFSIIQNMLSPHFAHRWRLEENNIWRALHALLINVPQQLNKSDLEKFKLHIERALEIDAAPHEFISDSVQPLLEQRLAELKTVQSDAVAVPSKPLVAKKKLVF